MFASRTLIATAAAVIALLGCGSGKDQQAPVDALSLGLPGTSTPTANWTLDGVPCTLIPVPAAAPFGTGTCPGVRPGAIVLTDVGQCTLNFLFQGSDGSRYIGTAGHCILGTSPFGGDVGEMAWAPGTGPVARDSEGNPIGEFAYAILQDPKDFSLIRLDPLVEASAAMCHRSEEHTSELQSHSDLVCRLLLEKKKASDLDPRERRQRAAGADPTGRVV